MSLMSGPSFRCHSCITQSTPRKVGAVGRLPLSGSEGLGPGTSLSKTTSLGTDTRASQLVPSPFQGAERHSERTRATSGGYVTGGTEPAVGGAFPVGLGGKKVELWGCRVWGPRELAVVGRCSCSRVRFPRTRHPQKLSAVPWIRCCCVRRFTARVLFLPLLWLVRVCALQGRLLRHGVCEDSRALSAACGGQGGGARLPLPAMPARGSSCLSCGCPEPLACTQVALGVCCSATGLQSGR